MLKMRTEKSTSIWITLLTAAQAHFSSIELVWLNSRRGIEGPPVSSLNCDRSLHSGLKTPELVMDAGCRDNRWTASLCTWPPGWSPLVLPPSQLGTHTHHRSHTHYSTPHTLWALTASTIWLMPQSPHHLQNDLKYVEWDVKSCSVQKHFIYVQI